MLSFLWRPFKLCKLRYIPIIAVYFCYGFSSVTGIAEMFWIKDHLSLSAAQLMQIAFWGQAPWTMKLIFAQFIENVEISGNRRKSYIIIGAAFMLLGAVMLIMVANSHPIVQAYGSVFLWLICSAVLMSIGFVVQDLVADTLCAELASPNQTKEQYKSEVGVIQVIGRISLLSAISIAAAIGGYITERYSFSAISWLSLISPIISVIGVLSLPKAIASSSGVFDGKILLFGVLLALNGAIMVVFKIPYGQEIVLLLNFVIIMALLKDVLSDYSEKSRQEIMIIGVMIFCFRLRPELSAAINWWRIDELHFDPQFISILAQTVNISCVIGTWLFATLLVNKDIGSIIIAITLIKAVLSIPDIAMSFGFHHWTEANWGFGARSMAMIDGSIATALDVMTMIPILALSVYYAPKVNKTIWFGAVACFLNLPLSAGTLVGQWLNNIFVIERGNYQQVSGLLIADLIITLVLPIAVVLICNKYRFKEVDEIN